jgi:hypothetical protein
MSDPELKGLLVGMIHQTRANYADLVDSMPDEATTPGQQALQAKHGRSVT